MVITWRFQTLYLAVANDKTLDFSILVNDHRTGSQTELHDLEPITEAITAETN